MISHRIMFAWLGTGAGHVSTAKALGRAIEERYGSNIEVHSVNAAGAEPNFARNILERGYTSVAVKMPLIWPILYQGSRGRVVMAFQSLLMNLVAGPVLRRYIRKHHIQRVVLLHFLLVGPLMRALKQLKKTEMPVVTVVTDPFSLHNFWAYKQAWPIVVFSEDARHRMERRLRTYALPKFRREGLPIKVLPPIIDERFMHPLSPEDNLANRRAEGFDPSLPFVLLTGGGDGLPGGPQILTALLDSGLSIQIAMVCGKNKEQFRTCTALAARYPEARVKVYGFVTIMYQLMNMADIVIGKGGPALVFETLCLAVPLLVVRRFYGQEQGNVDFLLRNHLGWYEPRPKHMVLTLRELLASPERLEAQRQRIRAMRQRSGTAEIVDYLLQ